MTEEPEQVWMVHVLTPIEGIRGGLSLEDEKLVFRPAGGRSAPTVVPLASIRRVRRARGSPVLEVTLAGSSGPPVIGFYFVKPPPLKPPTEGFRPFARYLARRRAVAALWAGNTAKHEEVERWLQAIRSKQQGTGEG